MEKEGEGEGEEGRGRRRKMGEEEEGKGGTEAMRGESQRSLTTLVMSTSGTRD